MIWSHCISHDRFIRILLMAYSQKNAIAIRNTYLQMKLYDKKASINLVLNKAQSQNLWITVRSMFAFCNRIKAKTLLSALPNLVSATGYLHCCRIILAASCHYCLPIGKKNHSSIVTLSSAPTSQTDKNKTVIKTGNQSLLPSTNWQKQDSDNSWKSVFIAETCQTSTKNDFYSQF